MRKKYVKKKKRFQDNRKLTDYSETFIYPVGIKSAQNINYIVAFL